MKYWKATSMIYGEEETEYISVSFGVTNKLYEEIQKLIESKKKIRESEIYRELCSKAEKAVCRELGSSDDYSIENTVIFDPTEFVIFKETIIGKKIKEIDPQKHEESFEFETGWPNFQEFNVVLEVEDGVILNVISINGVGVTSFGMKETFIDECPPDYDFILEQLEEYFED